MNVSDMATADLEQLRQQVAHRASQGEDHDEDLTQIEDLLARRHRELERQQLAEAEAVRLAEAEAAREREEETTRRAAQLAALLRSQTAAAGQVELAADALCTAVSHYLTVGREAYVVSGGRRTAIFGRRQLEAFLAWRLTEVLPRFAGMPRPDHQIRKPLTEMLGAERGI